MIKRAQTDRWKAFSSAAPLRMEECPDDWDSTAAEEQGNWGDNGN